jgi:hypothetical protein
MRPRVCFLVDHPNGAFDLVAQAFAEQLRDKIQARIAYAEWEPELNRNETDLLYAFCWSETWHVQCDLAGVPVIKEVASLRWQDPEYGSLEPAEFAAKWLRGCTLVTTPSRSIHAILVTVCDNVYHVPNGINPWLFYPRRRHWDSLRIGWVGNPKDSIKGLFDVLIPAAEGFDFAWSSGNWSPAKVANFYRSIDVLAIASRSESQPLPLMEGMACGCFPVTVNVGIVPELITDVANGLVVERSIEAFRKAFAWCSANLATVRGVGLSNADMVRQNRDWTILAPRLMEVISLALTNGGGVANAPIARLCVASADLPRDDENAGVPAFPTFTTVNQFRAAVVSVKSRLRFGALSYRLFFRQARRWYWRKVAAARGWLTKG